VERKFLSIRQAAGISSLSARFLYALCKDRKLKYYKIGKRILIDPEDLEQLITQDCVEPVDWSEKTRKWQ